MELHRSDRRPPAAAHQQRGPVAHVRGDLHARQPPVHLRRHRAGWRSAARIVPAVPRVRRQGRQRRSLCGLLRQRLSTSAARARPGRRPGDRSREMREAGEPC